MDAAVELNRVSKEFPVNLRGLRVRAVEDLSLRIPSGCVFGLLGPNGGGKSTTLKLILGLLAPTSGTVQVFGEPAGSLAARRRLGYLPDSPQFPRFVTGTELVTFHARLGELPRRGLAARVREAIAWVGLEGAADRRIGTYSKGMLQRIGLAQAIVHDPDLLILDEPAAGVDPLALAELSALLARLKAAGKTLLLTTHQLSSVEKVCDRVALLHRGRLRLEGDVAALAGTACESAPAVRVGGLEAGALAELRAWLETRGGRIEDDRPRRVDLEALFVRTLSEASAAAEGAEIRA
jgi:ABC-2 type transport system ATP-binding protein